MLDADTYVRDEAMTGPSNPKEDIRANDDMVVDKLEVARDRLENTTLAERNVLDGRIDAVEHRIVRKGICSISHRHVYEQHR